MAHISLSPKFIKEVFLLFRKKSLKELIFGKTVSLAPPEQELMRWIENHPDDFVRAGGRKGNFLRIDPIHKGTGMVYLLPNRLGDTTRESILIFDPHTKITQGPDLWVYLIKHVGSGEFLNLGLLKGTKGGQAYVIPKPLIDLTRYQSTAIWCKQFAVLFSYAVLE
ncbi:MAG: hypothetical protein G01um101466_501 [Parcubacteria group bacterium Gr01-1014_66]|nr:MAG: hypothetical protein G01um101466_501 [Parcubacteria group bacterium Gr01-1014_66]